jgi:hypothetical protein
VNATKVSDTPRPTPPFSIVTPYHLVCRSSTHTFSITGAQNWEDDDDGHNEDRKLAKTEKKRLKRQRQLQARKQLEKQRWVEEQRRNAPRILHPKVLLAIRNRTASGTSSGTTSSQSPSRRAYFGSSGGSGGTAGTTGAKSAGYATNDDVCDPSILAMAQRAIDAVKAAAPGKTKVLRTV